MFFFFFWGGGVTAQPYYNTLYRKNPAFPIVGTRENERYPRYLVSQGEGLGRIRLQQRLSAQHWVDGINMSGYLDMLIQKVFFFIWKCWKKWDRDLRDTLLHTKQTSELDVIPRIVPLNKYIFVYHAKLVVEVWNTAVLSGF